MQINFFFSATARKEIRKSFDWYEERSGEAADRFLESIDNAVIAISTNPEAYQNRNKNTREFVVDVFPFVIVYRFSKKENLIYILHVFHTSRHPRRKYRGT